MDTLFDTDQLNTIDGFAPPAEWFNTPPAWLDDTWADGLIQIGDDGRVAALVAPYKECILDGTGTCFTAPESPTNYEYAHVGALKTAEGDIIRVANVGGGTGHFDPSQATAMSPAVEHYANTASRIMVGRYHDMPELGGIVFLGSMWPGTGIAEVILARASALSGDWRWVETLRNYDMAGSQLVNNPGFRPSSYGPRQFAVVASMAPGHASPDVLRGAWQPQIVDPREELLNRVETIEAVLTAIVTEFLDSTPDDEFLEQPDVDDCMRVASMMPDLPDVEDADDDDVWEEWLERAWEAREAETEEDDEAYYENAWWAEEPVLGDKPKQAVVGAGRKKRRSRRPNPKSSIKEIVGSHGHRPHGPSILWPAMYEHLRAKGMTKRKAAMISNGKWNRKHGRPSKKPSVRSIASLAPVAGAAGWVPPAWKPPRGHHPPESTIDGEPPSGATIELVPENPEAFAVDGGDPADRMHATLKFLGRDASEWNPFERRKVENIVAAWAATCNGPIEAHISGTGHLGSEGEALVRHLDCEHLHPLRQRLSELIDGNTAPDTDDTYPSYKPHMTVGYNMDESKVPDADGEPVRFSTARIQWGNEYVDFPLGDPNTVPTPIPVARTAAPRVLRKARRRVRPRISKGTAAPGYHPNRHDYHDPTTGQFAPLGYVSPRILRKILSADKNDRIEAAWAIRSKLDRPEAQEWMAAFERATPDNREAIASKIRHEVLGARPTRPGNKSNGQADWKNLRRDQAAWDRASRELAQALIAKQKRRDAVPVEDEDIKHGQSFDTLAAPSAEWYDNGKYAFTLERDPDFGWTLTRTDTDPGGEVDTISDADLDDNLDVDDVARQLAEDAGWDLPERKELRDPDPDTRATDREIAEAAEDLAVQNDDVSIAGTDGNRWFHSSDESDLTPEGWMHLGTESVANQRASNEDRESFLHEFEIDGPTFNEPTEESAVSDKIANWVTGNRDFSQEEVVDSARAWDADDPEGFLAEVQEAADRGEAIFYVNTWDADEPSISVVARGDQLRTPASDAPEADPVPSMQDRLRTPEDEGGGGFTYDPAIADYPTQGIAVGRPGYSEIMTADAFFSDPDRARQFIRGFVEKMRNDPDTADSVVGGWYDRDNDEIVLDRVDIIEDREEAIRLGRERNEQGVFDLATGEYIDTGGTGGREDIDIIGRDEPGAPDGGPPGEAVERVDGRGSGPAGGPDVRGDDGEGPEGPTPEEALAESVQRSWAGVETPDTGQPVWVTHPGGRPYETSFLRTDTPGVWAVRDADGNTQLVPARYAEWQNNAEVRRGLDTRDLPLTLSRGDYGDDGYIFTEDRRPWDAEQLSADDIITSTAIENYGTYDGSTDFLDGEAPTPVIVASIDRSNPERWRIGIAPGVRTSDGRFVPATAKIEQDITPGTFSREDLGKYLTDLGRGWAGDGVGVDVDIDGDLHYNETGLDSYNLDEGVYRFVPDTEIPDARVPEVDDVPVPLTPPLPAPLPEEGQALSREHLRQLARGANHRVRAKIADEGGVGQGFFDDEQWLFAPGEEVEVVYHDSKFAAVYKRHPTLGQPGVRHPDGRRRRYLVSWDKLAPADGDAGVAPDGRSRFASRDDIALALTESPRRLRIRDDYLSAHGLFEHDEIDVFLDRNGKPSFISPMNGRRYLVNLDRFDGFGGNPDGTPVDRRLVGRSGRFAGATFDSDGTIRATRPDIAEALDAQGKARLRVKDGYLWRAGLRRGDYIDVELVNGRPTIVGEDGRRRFVNLDRFDGFAPAPGTERTDAPDLDAPESETPTPAPPDVPDGDLPDVDTPEVDADVPADAEPPEIPAGFEIPDDLSGRKADPTSRGAADLLDSLAADPDASTDTSTTDTPDGAPDPEAPDAPEPDPVEDWRARKAPIVDSINSGDTSRWSDLADLLEEEADYWDTNGDPDLAESRRRSATAARRTASNFEDTPDSEPPPVAVSPSGDPIDFNNLHTGIEPSGSSREGLVAAFTEGLREDPVFEEFADRILQHLKELVIPDAVEELNGLATNPDSSTAVIRDAQYKLGRIVGFHQTLQNLMNGDIASDSDIKTALLRLAIPNDLKPDLWDHVRDSANNYSLRDLAEIAEERRRELRGTDTSDFADRLTASINTETSGLSSLSERADAIDRVLEEAGFDFRDLTEGFRLSTAADTPARTLLQNLDADQTEALRLAWFRRNQTAGRSSGRFPATYEILDDADYWDGGLTEETILDSFQFSGATRRDFRDSFNVRVGDAVTDEDRAWLTERLDNVYGGERMARIADAFGGSNAFLFDSGGDLTPEGTLGFTLTNTSVLGVDRAAVEAAREAVALDLAPYLDGPDAPPFDLAGGPPTSNLAITRWVNGLDIPNSQRIALLARLTNTRAVTSDPEAVFRHELGHSVDNRLAEAGIRQAEYDAWADYIRANPGVMVEVSLYAANDFNSTDRVVEPWAEMFSIVTHPQFGDRTGWSPEAEEAFRLMQEVIDPIVGDAGTVADGGGAAPAAGGPV